MAYRAVFDAEGFPTAFYLPEIHGDAIPPEAIEITDAQWQEFIDNAGLRRWDGAHVVVYEPPQAPPPPAVLTARQLHRWLLSRGIALSAIDAAIADLPEPQRSAVQVDWQYATLFERANPLIDRLGAALGLTPEVIDQGFIDAREQWP